MKKISIYTRKGDDGTTSLVGGVRVVKTDARLEAYGTVDELSSQLGMLVTFIDDDQDKSIVERIQNNLFVVCSYLATDQSRTELLQASILDSNEITMIENAIDKIDEI